MIKGMRFRVETFISPIHHLAYLSLKLIEDYIGRQSVLVSRPPPSHLFDLSLKLIRNKLSSIDVPPFSFSQFVSQISRRLVGGDS